jgi:Domain of unknown function (DUF4333)
MKGIIVGCVATAALASVVVFGGCSESFCVGSGCSISGDTVAKKADEAFADKQGLPPLPPVTCSDDLDLKTGATTHCVAKGKFNGRQRTLGITAKVKSVHGQNYDLDFQTTGFEQ